MNDYEAVVADYIAADRATFVSTQCLIQLNEAANPDTSGAHWYCDTVAVDFRDERIFLCEVSFAATLSALVRRLHKWREHWPQLCLALRRDSRLPSWPIRIWLFVPHDCVALLVKQLGQLGFNDPLEFHPRITTLEMTQPWKYRSWDRVGEGQKPEAIPPAMRD